MRTVRIETGTFIGMPEMDGALEATGWLKAEQHFVAACNAAVTRDDLAYHREMAAFNAIKSTWNLEGSRCGATRTGGK